MDKNDSVLTQEKIKKMLKYDPETGIFKWNINSRRKKINDVAGFIDPSNGYIRIELQNKKYYAHRLVFLYIKGYFPENCVDHINRQKTDNRWCNLREISVQCNLRNSKIQINNTSGIRGISWCTRNKWEVYVKINNKRKGIGRFSDFSEAVAHRLAVEQCLNWNGCDANSTAFLYMKKYLEKNK